MRFHQSTRARTLSFALAGIGLLAVAAPAAANHDVFKQRVELTRVVQTESGDYRVKGRVHSPVARCRKRMARLYQGVGGRTDWKDRTTRRGKFSIRVPQSEEGRTFRVRAPGVQCASDKSRWFTLPPASEAGIAAAASASAAADVVKYDTTLTLTKDMGGNYHGKVYSDRDRNPEYHPAKAVRKCAEGRRVTLFKIRPGADHKLRTDLQLSELMPNGHGVWWMHLGRDYGDHVRARVESKVRDGFVCRADRAAYEY
jgi:hypothetical protein